jgi:hypothetical protein
LFFLVAIFTNMLHCDTIGRKSMIMGLADLSYSIYRASSGRSSFWRWEVREKRLKAPIRSGFLYGTMTEAKQRASTVMLDLARPSAAKKSTSRQ